MVKLMRCDYDTRKRMRYEERILPHARAWLECGWIAETQDAVPGHRVLPDGCVDMVYDHVFGLRIVGAMTQAQSFDLPANIWVAAVRLRPGAAGALFRCPAEEFTNRSYPLPTMSKLRDARSSVEALDILGSSIPSERPVTPVGRAIHAMVLSRGTIQLDYVARQANLSVRQFRRRCAEESGLTPSRLNRVLRFRHAARLANERRNPKWSTIAADAGYFDQAHFINDCRAFTGHTPMSVFSKTAEASASTL